MIALPSPPDHCPATPACGMLGRHHTANRCRPRPGRSRSMDPNALIALLVGLIVLLLLLAGL